MQQQSYVEQQGFFSVAGPQTPESGPSPSLPCSTTGVGSVKQQKGDVRCSMQERALQADVAEHEASEADNRVSETVEDQDEASEADSQASENVEDQASQEDGASGSEEQVSVGDETAKAPGSKKRRRLTATVTGSTVSSASFAFHTLRTMQAVLRHVGAGCKRLALLIPYTRVMSSIRILHPPVCHRKQAAQPTCCTSSETRWLLLSPRRS